MIDPQAPVLLPGPRLIVPEGVQARFVRNRTQRIGQAEPQQRLEGFAGGRAEQGIIGPGGGIVDVLCRRDDVEVACKDQRLFRLEPLLRVLKKSRHPFEFIGIFIAIRRVSIRQIKAGDPHHAVLVGDYAFEEPGMGVLVITGQSRLGLVERQLRQQRDAVECLLAVGDDVVAERLDLQPGESVIDAFYLLEADDVGRTLLEPGQEELEPLPDRIDVPRSNTHGRPGILTRHFRSCGIPYTVGL